MKNIRYTIRQGIQGNIFANLSKATSNVIEPDDIKKTEEDIANIITRNILFRIQEPINPKDNEDY